MIQWRDMEGVGSNQNGASKIMWVDELPASTHYQTLGVHRKASTSIIKRAYRALVTQHHPDLHHGSSRPIAEARMQQINAAYCVLRSASHREAYDATLDPRSARL
jgi:DnaJ-class molecular chaperone